MITANEDGITISDNSRLRVLGEEENHISGGGGVNLMYFLFLCVQGDFLRGMWDSGRGKSPRR